ncbi:MAG: hypothetical protein NTY64_01225 [Deltaproteobacteria bacterium]|nr:hypothetical protein [Deltaproteobacteria bacterium]
MSSSSKERRSTLESAISLLLILGVVTSLLLETLGISLDDLVKSKIC